MSNSLVNCTITKQIFDGENEQLTLTVTANDGYTFLGLTDNLPRVTSAMYDTIYLEISADGKSASCVDKWMGDGYSVKAAAIQEHVQQFVHDTSGVQGNQYLVAYDDSNTILPNAFTTPFDKDTTIGSLIGSWYIGISKDYSTYKILGMQTCTATFTDSTGVVRTINLLYDYDSKCYFTDMSSEELEYKVASNIVWVIPTKYIEPVTPTYKITQSLTDCTSDCSLTEIQGNTALTVTVVPNDGFEFTTVPTCEMGNQVVVASQLENSYKFVIEAVNADITIVAKATSTTPTEVNNADFGFINIYNPTEYELQEASKKWFYDMTAGSYIDLSKYISALFITYGKPLVLTEKQSIKFSSYDTKVLTHIVREPQIEVDCGTITVEELHHNALDYSPNSSVRIFLPFIGYENIDIDLIMDSELSLKYVIDALSGRCIANLKCNKNGNVIDIYSFVGDCSLQIPYFMNNAETNSNTIVTRAHNLDSRTPFLLIERATAYMPNSSRLDGVSSNELAILGDLTGYTKCKEVNVYGVDCTSSEKNEIETLLKKGVIL